MVYRIDLESSQILHDFLSDILLPSFVLGLFDDAGIRDETLFLSPGEGILLYTDGLTEAINPQKEFFGMDRPHERP